MTSEDAKTIRIVDVASDRIVGSFESGGQGPHILIPLPDRKTLLVGIVDDDSASSIDIATKRVTLTVGARRPPSRRSAPWMTLADRKTIGQ